jgi:hypothetical protein
MGERRGAPRVLVGKPEGKMGGMDWIDLAQDRDRWLALENAIMKLRFPKKYGEFPD